MDVAADDDRGLHRHHVRLLLQDLPRLSHSISTCGAWEGVACEGCGEGITMAYGAVRGRGAGS